MQQERWVKPDKDIELSRCRRQIRSAARAVKRGLEAEAAVARRESLRLAAKQRDLREQRWRWLRRSDLTMDEMMQGLPAHLRGDVGGDG